jgi:hypothetical protein
VSKNGDSTGDGSSSENGVVPRLTIGQRVLASLPNLQRTTSSAPDTSTRPSVGDSGDDGAVGPGGAAAPGTSGGAGDDDVVTPDAVLAPGAGATVSGRLRDAFMKPPAPRRARGAPSGMTKEELAHIIKRLDDRERFLALISAPVGVVVGVLLTIGALHFNPPLHHKNHESTGLIVFEGGARVLLSAIVVLAAWTRRRSFVAFALLFLGTSMAFPFALPFWALGVWMIFRVFKWQKELAAMTGGQARARPTTSTRARADPAARGREAAEARRQARADRVRARTAGGRRAKKQPEPTGPPPSKRYTPPKPGRPRPPAS